MAVAAQQAACVLWCVSSRPETALPVQPPLLSTSPAPLPTRLQRVLLYDLEEDEAEEAEEEEGEEAEEEQAAAAGEEGMESDYETPAGSM